MAENGEYKPQQLIVAKDDGVSVLRASEFDAMRGLSYRERVVASEAFGMICNSIVLTATESPIKSKPDLIYVGANAAHALITMNWIDRIAAMSGLSDISADRAVVSGWLMFESVILNKLGGQNG
jgi:hypothetical protein